MTALQRFGWKTKSDLSEHLGLKLYQLNYLIKTGVMPEPSHEIGKKRYYNEQDFRELAKKLKAK
jgi:DNA-binding transcriptional MerR regulator